MPRVPKLKVEITAEDKLSKQLRGIASRTSRAIRGIGSAAMGTAKAIGVVGAAAGGAAYGVYRLTRSYSESLDALDEQAQSVGRSAQSLREWQYVAARAGVGSDELVGALGKMNVEVSKVKTGQGALNKLFDLGGQAYRKRIVEAKTLEEAQAALFDAIRDAPKAEDKARIARAAFGNVGKKLLPIIGQTNEELASQFEQFRRLRGVLRPEDVRTASDMEDAVTDITEAFGGLRDAVASDLIKEALPAVKSLTEWLADNRGKVATQIADGIKNVATELAKVDWKAVAGTMLDAAKQTASLLSVAVDAAKLLSGDFGVLSTGSRKAGSIGATASRVEAGRIIRPLSEAPRSAEELAGRSALVDDRGIRWSERAPLAALPGGPTAFLRPMLQSLSSSIGGKIEVVVKAADGSAVQSVRTTSDGQVALPVSRANTGTRGL